jgi:predicted Rdx family selenoprotein
MINALKNNIMTTSINHFSFEFMGYGHYKVTYTSPATGKEWSKTINDMTIIDRTKNADYPTVASLNQLKKLVKA